MKAQKHLPGKWPPHYSSRVVYTPTTSSEQQLNDMRHEAELTTDWLLTSGTWQDDRWTIPFEDCPSGLALPLTERPFQLVWPDEIWLYLTPHSHVYVRTDMDAIVPVELIQASSLGPVLDEAIYLLQLTRSDQ